MDTEIIERLAKLKNVKTHHDYPYPTVGEHCAWGLFLDKGIGTIVVDNLYLDFPVQLIETYDNEDPSVITINSERPMERWKMNEGSEGPAIGEFESQCILEAIDKALAVDQIEAIHL